MALVPFSNSSNETSGIIIPIQAAEDNLQLSAEAIQLWNQLYPNLTDSQKIEFAKLASPGLESAVKSLAEECQEILDNSIGNKIQEWLGPLHAIADLAGPIVKFATTTAGVPSPTDVVTGGLKAILQLTKAKPDLQRRAIRLLTRMSQKAQVLNSYNWTLYRREMDIQAPILELYSDIATFCVEVKVLFGNQRETGFQKFKTSIKNSVSMAFLDKFSEALTDHVTKFENDFDLLRDAILSIQLRNQQKILDNQELSLRKEDQFQRLVLQSLRHTEGLLIEDRQIRREETEQKQRKAERKNFSSCLSWLSSLDFHPLYQERCEVHLPGTGSWLIESPEYLNWTSNRESALLWIKGKAGSGKSILAAVAITNLNNNMSPNVGVAYALCQRNQQTEQTVAALLGSLIKQLSSQRNEVHGSVRGAYSQSQSGKLTDKYQALELLARTTSLFEEVYLVIDAIDEFKEADRLTNGLLDMLQDQRAAHCVKILILNRPTSSIDSLLSSHGHIAILTEANNKLDIDRYIDLHLPQPEHADARTLCSQKALGMFMWVRLVFDNLGNWLSDPEDIISVINDLPDGIDKIYDIIFEQINAQPTRLRQKAWQILYWIQQAFVPLNLPMMQAALADYDKISQFKEIGTTTTADKMIELCKHLVVLDQNGDFSFIHESVRLYLVQDHPSSKALQDFQEAGKAVHDRMTLTCLRHLQLIDFNQSLPSTIEEFDFLFSQAPFRYYSAVYWGDHASRGNHVLHKKAILHFLRLPAHREMTHQVHWDTHGYGELPFWNYPGSSTSLSVIALFNLSPLLPDAFELDGRYEADGSGSTALMYALRGGHEDSVIAVIDLIYSDRSAPVGHREKDLKEALSFAVEKDWIRVLEKLHSINPELFFSTPETLGFDPLFLACVNKNQSAARKLVDLGGNVSLVSQSKSIPLIEAASNRLTDTVLLLLSHGADVNARDDYGYTALHYSVFTNNEIITEALLKHGADISLQCFSHGHNVVHMAAYNNSTLALHVINRLRPDFNIQTRDKDGCTALHRSSFVNAAKCSELLISLGCPVNAIDRKGNTALHDAIRKAAIETIKILLLNRASVDKTDADGNTAFHLAAISSSPEVLEILFTYTLEDQWSSKLDVINNKGKTPLHFACWKGNKRIIRIFVDKGSNCNSRDYQGWLPLHIAAFYGHARSIPLLFSMTKDVHSRTDTGLTSLHLAALSGNEDCFHRLFEAASELGISLDTSAVNNHNETPLVISLHGSVNEAQFWSNEIFNILLPITPKTTHRYKTWNGLELIHLAAFRGETNLLQILLTDDRSSAIAKTDDGTLPIHIAVAFDNMDAFKYLLPFSLASLEESNEDGDTMLLIALDAKRIEMANLLLDAGANVHVTNIQGNSPLHLAVPIGDQLLLKRLLSIGCRGSKANNKGVTPFHLAAINTNLKMIQDLRAYGLVDSAASDKNGCTAIDYAMACAPQTFINELHMMGVPLDSIDTEGGNAAHYAAFSGHLDTLKYLEHHGVDIYKVDLNGYTPFLTAALAGFVQIVEYYLDKRPLVVLDRLLHSGATALALAADSGSHSVISLLLGAGIDQTIPDAFGYTFEDIINSSSGDGHSSLILSQTTRDESQKRSIQTLLQDLLQYDTIRDYKETQSFEYRFSILAQALRLHGDLELSRLCMYHRLFEPHTSVFFSPPECDTCGEPCREDKIFICSSCHMTRMLCERCHDDYNSAGRAVPEALLAVSNLEGLIYKARRACVILTDLRDVADVMSYLNYTIEFMNDMRSSYEQWETDHRADTRFVYLERPGQQWIKMIQDFLESRVVEDTINSESEIQHSQEIEDSLWQYQVLCREHEPFRDRGIFPCKGHEYIQMTKEEYDQLRAGSDLYDACTGEPTEKLLNRIANKYRLEEAEVAVAAQTAETVKSKERSSGQPNSPVSPDGSLDQQTDDPMAEQVKVNTGGVQKDNKEAIGSIVSPTDFPTIEASMKTILTPEGPIQAQTALEIYASNLKTSESNTTTARQLQPHQQPGQKPGQENMQDDDRDDIEKMADRYGIKSPASRTQFFKLCKIVETIDQRSARIMPLALHVTEAITPGYSKIYIDDKYKEMFEKKP